MILPLLLNKLHSNSNFFILSQLISKINEILRNFLKKFEAASQTLIQFEIQINEANRNSIILGKLNRS